MRIALTCNFSPWSSYSGGAQRSTHALACALARKGHDVTVIYTKPRRERLQVPSELPYHIRWARFFARKATRRSPLRPFNALTIRAELTRLHAQSALDVIHGQGEEAALVNRLSFRERVRFVLTPRYPSFPASFRPDASAAAKARLWLRDTKYPLLGVALSAADHVCPTSLASASALKRAFGVNFRCTKIIPNGVDDRFLTVQWQGPREGAPLIFFGRIEADKGVDTLLRAMVDIDRRLLIVGRGDQQNEYEKLSKTLALQHRVQFLGWLPPEQIAELLASSAAAVLPSRAESFGNAMAEVLAAGVPLITTRVGSIPEVVGDAAVLTDPAEPRALSAAVQSLLNNQARAVELGTAGRNRVRERLSWDRVADAYAELYENPL